MATRPLAKRTLERDVREAIREARTYGDLALVAAVIGTVSKERLEAIDGGAQMTDEERSWLAAHLVD